MIRRLRPAASAARARLLALLLIAPVAIPACKSPSGRPSGVAADASVGKGRRVRHQLIFSDGFERGRYHGWDLSWIRHKPAISVVTAPRPVRAGRHALHVTLRRDQPMYSKGKRSELAVPGHYALGKDYWYGFSVFVPASWKDDFQGDVISQWFATPDKHLGERGRSPSLALRIKDKRWLISGRFDPRALTPANSGAKITHWKGPLGRGVWTDWVFHVRWSYRGDGQLEIWQNGQRLTSTRGPTTYNDRVGPLWKIGLYKAPWNKPETPSAVSAREIYFDEIRVGQGPAGYRSVAPSPRPRH